MEEIDRRVNAFIHDVSVGKIQGSYNITMKTLELFKYVINGQEWSNAASLMKIIRERGHLLQTALPHETVTANMARRLLKIIREEFEQLQANDRHLNDESEASLSLHKLVTQTSEFDVSIDYSKVQSGLREAILDQVQEIETDLETSTENICAQAEEHIHSSEVILTLGYSRSVEHFLARAIKRRQSLTIIIAEYAPECRGHNLAAKLANDNVEIIVIPDSAIFAMMSRINKVIIGTNSVLANGGLRAACGALTVALAAKHYSVPVIVLAPMYKLSAMHLCAYEQDAFNIIGSSEGVVSYNSLAAQSAKIYSPVFDYVPPELVTVFISNNGGHAPSYVYRLLTEMYHPEDYEL